MFPQYRVITKRLSALFVHFVLRAVFFKRCQDQRLTVRNCLPDLNNAVGVHRIHYFVVKFLWKQRYIIVLAHLVSVCHIHIVLVHVLRRHAFGHGLTDDVCILEVVSLPRHVSRARVDTQRHSSLFVCKVRTHQVLPGFKRISRLQISVLVNISFAIKRMMLKHLYFVCLSVCVLHFNNAIVYVDHFAVLFGSDGSHVRAKFMLKVFLAFRSGNSSTYKRSFGVF